MNRVFLISTSSVAQQDSFLIHPMKPAEEAEHEEEPPKDAQRGTCPDRKAGNTRMRAGADNRRVSQIIGVNLPQGIDDRLTERYRQLIDLTPLPRDFDYEYMFQSYIWRAVFLTSFTLGIRIGNIEAISGIFLKILGSYIIFIIAYMAIPAGLVYVDSRAEQKRVNIYERRILLIGVAALLGVLGSIMNQHYIIMHNRPPSYFLPGLVTVTVQVVGPKFANNRVNFIAVSVGTAYAIGIIIMAYFHDLYVSTLIDLTVSAMIAVMNLQFILAAIIQHKANMMEAHVLGVIMALYQHLIFSRTLGTYKDEEKAAPSLTGPILYS
ncbi:hypothetical protein GCK32_007491 [Trichostrongylus colubriformis]|uniref:Uncharacterized protein n=1 Tax=Trichostrongylus colubriformis TaxID=6319 RepID=A0AAN8ITN3_TRICO